MSSIIPEIPINGGLSNIEPISGKLSPSDDKLVGIISDVSQHSGSVSSENELIGILSGIDTMVGSISQADEIEGSISDELLTARTYDGSYTVVPRKVPQTLHTSDKYMVRDVEINEISYSEVSNPEGGLTINIGYE